MLEQKLTMNMLVRRIANIEAVSLRRKPKRRRFKDYNEYLWHLHEREVALVRQKRAENEGEKPISELWREWARQQLEELARRKNGLRAVLGSPISQSSKSVSLGRAVRHESDTLL